MAAPDSIGILGGSFDPVHTGHRAIARSFLKSNRIDELWVMLTPAPPHKPDRDLAPWDLRLEMLKAAFGGEPRIRVSDLERRLKQPSYTWRTLEHLRNSWPERKFVLCLGGDSLTGFTHWKRWKRILDLVPLLVAERPGSDRSGIPELLKERTVFVEHTPVEISSSRIRDLVAAGGNAAPWLPDGVEEIIRRNRLYRRNSYE